MPGFTHLSEVGVREQVCGNCPGIERVCENHPDLSWNANLGCECGAGAPCPVCQPSLATAGYTMRIVQWLEAEAEIASPPAARHILRDIAKRIEAAEYLSEEERQKAGPFASPLGAVLDR
jgi:hypothetical protein